MTIRLPGRAGEEGAEGEEAGTPGAEGVEGEVLGGGKPFRMIQGKTYVIEGDEFVTENDPKGDTKIDANGVLQGGRQFKAGTFVLPRRHPERRYMLAIDAARTSGFRDSLYYFRRNPLALKLSATQPEKEYLIEIGKLGSHLRTRSVTLVTARSAYKLHGAKTIIDGKWVTDDYYEDKALEEITAKGLKPGDPVGELQEPQTAAAAAAAAAALQEPAQKAERGAGLGMYRAGGPTTLFGGSGLGPYSDGPLNAVKKSYLYHEGLDEANWMWAAAQRTAELNAELTKQRSEILKPCGGIFGDNPPGAREATQEVEAGEKREGTEGPEGEGRRKRRKVRMDDGGMPLGVYEPHSGVVLYREDTQPTRSRWEGLRDDGERRQVLGGTKAGNGAWALAWIDTVMEPPGEDLESKVAHEREQLLAQVAT
ncbi:hypothetical protein EWM64_g1396 [Hericium alpestre]|uniref:Uncharacterized protein n=1 Tax=Hericium alpestre TaxID=135208 RepID=A0A4Z0A7Z6_9AGAM|nr:hypothetical protein EWM64_g1396 [Hericium alpestre]